MSDFIQRLVDRAAGVVPPRAAATAPPPMSAAVVRLDQGAAFESDEPSTDELERPARTTTESHDREESQPAIVFRRRESTDRAVPEAENPVNADGIPVEGDERSRHVVPRERTHRSQAPDASPVAAPTPHQPPRTFGAEGLPEPVAEGPRTRGARRDAASAVIAQPTEPRQTHRRPQHVGAVATDAEAFGPAPGATREEAPRVRPAATSPLPVSLAPRQLPEVLTARDGGRGTIHDLPQPRNRADGDIVRSAPTVRETPVTRPISVQIGTIEIRAAAPAATAPPQKPATTRSAGFEEFAALRRYASWSGR
jgi:hypothetical protein